MANRKEHELYVSTERSGTGKLSLVSETQIVAPLGRG